MDLRKLSIVLAAAASLNGCQVVKNDFTRPGGAVGAFSDEWMPAPTKRLQLYRAIVVLAFFSRMGADLATNSDNAVALYRYMLASKNDINLLAGSLFSGCRSLETKCEKYPQLFESDLPVLEGHLYKVAVAALPSKEAETIISDLGSGAYLDAILKLTKLGGSLVSAGHQVAASYRSEREIFGYITAKAKPPAPIPQDVASAIDLIKDKGPVSAEFDVALMNYNSGVYDVIYAITREACVRLKGRMNSTDSPEKINCDDFALKPA